MFDFSIIVWLFLIVFMLHEFEEIIFLKPWVGKNSAYLSKRFPKLTKRFMPRFENMSIPAFAVAEEFILLSIITISSVLLDNYLLWFGVFMGFFMHLLIHLAQWLILRKYIPVIYTTIISLVYCLFSLRYILKENLFQIHEIIIWIFIGFGIVNLNLLLAHKLAVWFDKKYNKQE
ncbi:MAG: HXXEE domain-containing protein [Dysgonamonadaceae bacterium]|nr:HXXEE domain-containing protein [Dysgonamonadaceae bacterium]